MCSTEVTDIRSIENFRQDKHIFYLKRTAVYTDILPTIPAILHLKSMNDSSSENTKS